MSTENGPHIVYPADRPHGIVFMFPTYRAAYDFWRLKHDYTHPYRIATVGRVIDPSTPIVDVSE